MNDTLDWQRIQHLLKLGTLASLMMLTGDMLLGMQLIGNYGMTNALAAGWISIGNLWMMSGLLSASRKVGK